MSEVMAIESIAEEYAKFLGYLTESRVPFKLKKGISDIDVLGYSPKTKKSLMIECKAWGGPEDYSSFNGDKPGFKQKFKEMINKWAFFKKSRTNRWNIKNLDEVWFIIPGFCDDKDKIEKELSIEFEKTIKIIPIHELILNIMLEVKKDKNIRRKRYSNPALEFCRWLLRSYDTGHLSLIDIDLKLKEEKQTYDLLKKNYFKECLRVVEKNTEKRKAGIDTRIKTLKLLIKLKKATIPQIQEEGNKSGYELNYNRVNVGLGTWIELSIVSENDQKEFFIVNSFYDIVKNELK